MRNGVGTTCKVTAAITFLLCIISGFVFRERFGEYGELSVMNAFSIWGSGFIFCLLLYAAGEILHQLAISNANTYELYQTMQKSQPVAEKEPRKDAPAPPYFSKPALADNGGWICNKCSTINERNKTFCKDCGVYR